MVKTLIAAFPTKKREARNDGTAILNVSEMFMDTIQGENYVGVPATFLRLQRCTLNCVWCDTKEVWRKGNPYSVKEILEMWDENGTINRFIEGQHLVLTGGSPLLQQDVLGELLIRLENEYKVVPYVEIENECVLIPGDEMIKRVNCWNNSPKLANSQNPRNLYHKPEVIKFVASLPNSWFKFVVESEEDWDEIEKNFITPGLISKNQIVLMPEGMTRIELQQHYDIVAKLACDKGVRMTDRLHVTMWDKKTGV